MQKYKSDIEIAQNADILPIYDIASKIGIESENLKHYGDNIAKVDLNFLNEKIAEGEHGKLVLVTAINPTPAGEGKTTTTIGLCDAISKLNKNSVCALREPSLGPVFGMKGGACGGGMSQVIPMEEINLHFTGDIHAIGAANNLLAAMIDAHIQNGNELDIDVKNITWKRALDMNDRQLRHIVSGLGGSAHGVPREDGFDITVASEIMAVFCLARDLSDLKSRLSKITVAFSRDGKPITVSDLSAQGALTALLKDALFPNLVQTLEGNPAFVHGGPFANIAHGCNSLIATRAALSCGDYCITEAGFGADLGAEKFLDIKCRIGGLVPDCVVLVATIRALKYHGGAEKSCLSLEDTQALKDGLPNLLAHIDNIRDVYHLPCVVALNSFVSDTDDEIEILKRACEEKGVEFALARNWEEGSAGAIDLASKVIDVCENGGRERKSDFEYCYGDNLSAEEKIEAVVKKIYHGKGVVLEAKASKSLQKIHEMNLDSLPICIAKTQYSFSDHANALGAPKDFDVTIRDVKACTGAGFIVALAGNIMTMPGLGKKPAAMSIDVDDKGQISGLF